MKAKARPDDVRESCITEAFRIIEEQGVENLSLRDVARRVGVSHQAPYKHFPSRDHIMAEIVARCFDEFAKFLEARPANSEPHDDLRNMGLRYLDYARLHPLKYRLMFNTPLPEPRQHPRMMQNANQAFTILRDRLRSMPLKAAHPLSPHSAEFDAMFIWSTLHGLSSLLESDLRATLDMPVSEHARAVQRCFARLSLALTGDDGAGVPPKHAPAKPRSKPVKDHGSAINRRK